VFTYKSESTCGLLFISSFQQTYSNWRTSNVTGIHVHCKHYKNGNISETVPNRDIVIKAWEVIGSTIWSIKLCHFQRQEEHVDKPFTIPYYLLRFVKILRVHTIHRNRCNVMGCLSQQGAALARVGGKMFILHPTEWSIEGKVTSINSHGLLHKCIVIWGGAPLNQAVRYWNWITMVSNTNHVTTMQMK